MRLCHTCFCLSLVAVMGCSATTVGHATTKAKSSGARHVTLLHIADTHAQLESHPEYMPGQQAEIETMGGYARLKTALDRERLAARGPVFAADGGDTFQGSGPAAWSQGEVVLGPLNALGLDVCVPGNWEVVYGPQRFRELMKRVSCAVTAYNFHESETGKRLFAPQVTIEKDGVRVAFVGITDPTTTKRQPPDQVVGLDSTRLDGLRDFVKALRVNERADLVVAVTHTGLSVSRQLAREIPELDVVLSGHTHERTEHAIREGDVIVVEPGSMGSFLGRLDLTLGAHGGVEASSFKLIPIREADYPEDPGVKKIVDAALAPYRMRAAEVVGRTNTALLRYDVLESTMDNFVAEAVRETGATDLGISNGFRFAPPVPAGPITEGDLWNILPLDARMKKGWVTGAQLRGYLENELELVFSRDPWKLSGGWGPRVSGMTMTFAAEAEKGARLREITVNGSPMRDDGKYSLAGCERAGERLDMICRLAGAHDPIVMPMTVHEALRAYLMKHPIIAPVRDGRATAVDLPATIFSQDETLHQHH